MTSKQINFFHSNDEVKKFINFFKEKGFVLYPYLVNNLDEIKREESLSKQNKIEIVFDSNKTEYKFIEKQNYYLFNPEKSYVVEFLLCVPSKDNKIESGRLYYTPKYYENGNYTLKSDSFINEAENLLKEFKKEFIKKTEFSGNWFFTEDINNLFKNNLAEWTQNNNVVKLKILENQSQVKNAKSIIDTK